ncbi:MAG: DUF1566 domain-containing protein [Nitrospirae bacterium]|nr:DUF1566 domain-containing protein [Nitrospirota bacterium]
MKRTIFFVFTVALLLCCSAALSFAAPFTDNGNGTVTDNRTGLVWQQGEAGQMMWGSALSYCEGLPLGGKTDWRLPNVKELESLTDDTRYNDPAIDTSVVLHKSLYIKDPARRQCCHSRGSNRESIVFQKQIKTWIPA